MPTVDQALGALRELHPTAPPEALRIEAERIAGARETMRDTREEAASPRLPDRAEAPWLLIRTPSQAPLAYPSLDALARAVQRERGDAGLELVEREQRVCGEDLRRRVVQVDVLDADGVPLRRLGCAWLDGGGRAELEAALRAVVNDANAVRGEAAQ